MSSEPPEEPRLYSDFALLSPASPKPIRFPTPAAIPVLDMQTDIGFNQTEAHSKDPVTELRPNLWHDPNDEDVTDHKGSPFSTGFEETAAAQQPHQPAEIQESGDSAEPGRDIQPGTTVNSISHEANAGVRDADVTQNLSDPINLDESRVRTEASQIQNESTSLDQRSNAQSFDNSVDIQALLNTLQTAPAPIVSGDAAANVNTAPEANGITVATTASPSSQSQSQPAQPDASTLPAGVEGESSPISASGLGVPPNSLPARPPPQQQPLIHPNYVHSQHIRDYHPHAVHSAFQPHGRSTSQGTAADPSSRSFVPPVHSPTASTAPGIPQSASGYPANISIPTSNVQNTSGTGFTPSPATFSGFAVSPEGMYGGQYPPTSSTPMESQREAGVHDDDTIGPWDGEVQRKYDSFIEDERRYVAEGRWEQFPAGSRLFVGNLSSEKVTKRDIFHVFHEFGKIGQISIKQAYGFVQFLRAEDCTRALHQAQGRQIQDKKIHLEVSKPQKNRNQNNQRRSRSPPAARGRQSDNGDRFGSRGGNNRSTRDDYRPAYRSPSPRGYRDRYDDRHGARPHSPGYGRGGRYRSPSPQRGSASEDDLPLPRRAPNDVPDVQIIVLDSLDRDFISWVEKSFSARNVRVDVLLLSPRLSEQAVIKRQITEGVVAIVKLNRQNQLTAKISLQLFDRRQGASNVKFEEYDNLEPHVAVELVLRAKQTHAPPPQTPTGGYGGYGGQQHSAPPAQQYGSYPPPTGQYQPTPQPSGYPPNYGPPPPQSAPLSALPNVPANLQHLITNLDPNNLQSLLSAMNTPQSANPTTPYGNQSQQQAAIATLQQNPGLAGYLQQQQQAQAAQPGSAGAGAPVNMQEILARLGNYQR